MGDPMAGGRGNNFPMDALNVRFLQPRDARGWPPRYGYGSNCGGAVLVAIGCTTFALLGGEVRQRWHQINSLLPVRGGCPLAEISEN